MRRHRVDSTFTNARVSVNLDNLAVNQATGWLGDSSLLISFTAIFICT